MFVRFALWLAVSKIQGRQKSEMHRVTPNWTWTVNSQKYPIHTKYSPPRSKFWSVSLRPTVSKISHILSFPIDSHVKRPKTEQKKKNAKNPNFEISQCYSLSNFGRDSPQEYAWFFVSESGVYFQRRGRLKFLLPYGPMLTWWIGTCQ